MTDADAFCIIIAAVILAIIYFTTNSIGGEGK
jgi:hypothetical protein